MAALEPVLAQEIGKLSPHQQTIGKGLFNLLQNFSKQRAVQESMPQINTPVAMCPHCGRVYTLRKD